MSDLSGKTLFITGASRGIGKAIALRAAQDGANIAVVAKTAEPHPRLPGTIHSAAEELREAGGRALAIQLDVRDPDAIEVAVQRTVEEFGGIDVLVNNASAISLTGTLETPMKRFDLMMGVNVRATFACTQACLPYLFAAENPHVLVLGPPLSMKPRWFQNNVAYTISKYGMSMCVLGMAEEFRSRGVAVNALWPRTAIDTAALRMIPGIDPNGARTVEMVADAAHAVLTRPAAECTGNFYLDEDVLREQGVEDFEGYAVKPGTPLIEDFFVD